MNEKFLKGKEIFLASANYKYGYFSFTLKEFINFWMSQRLFTPLKFPCLRFSLKSMFPIFYKSQKRLQERKIRLK